MNLFQSRKSDSLLFEVRYQMIQSITHFRRCNLSRLSMGDLHRDFTRTNEINQFFNLSDTHSGVEVQSITDSICLAFCER